MEKAEKLIYLQEPFAISTAGMEECNEDSE